MILSHVLFAYPRIELNYIKDCLDFHHNQGVDHFYIGLHLNQPRDKILNFSDIVWSKKPDIPYITEYTENELFELFMDKIKDYKKNISIKVFNRLTDTTDDIPEHRLPRQNDQLNCYRWAYQQIIDKNHKDYDWLIVGDVDEYFLPENNFSIKDILLDNKYQNVSSLRCWSIMHPSRYDTNTLDWNTYCKFAGRKLVSSKYICRCSMTKDFTIHYSLPISDQSITDINPSINVHHFRGFDKYRLNKAGWPKRNKFYIEKTKDEPYTIIKKGLYKEQKSSPKLPGELVNRLFKQN